MNATNSDRIEKKILLKAPRSRVWHALTVAKQLGAWFGVRLEGEFAPGVTIRGRITVPKYEHVVMEMTVERMEPERYFSWRWHPYAVDPKVDYASEPTTLVEFELEETPGGTLLSVVESGFDRIPLSRRAEAYRANDGGWAFQVEAIRAYVSRAD